MFQKKLAWQECIQKQINTFCSDLEMLKIVQHNSNVKISKSRKLRAKYKIKCPEEIQNFLEEIKQTIQANKSCKIKTISKTISFLQR